MIFLKSLMFYLFVCKEVSKREELKYIQWVIAENSVLSFPRSVPILLHVYGMLVFCGNVLSLGSSPSLSLSPRFYFEMCHMYINMHKAYVWFKKDQPYDHHRGRKWSVPSFTHSLLVTFLPAPRGHHHVFSWVFFFLSVYILSPV